MKVRFWRLLVVGGMAVVGVGAAGCKRSACEPVPLDAFWEARKNLVPPGAVICKAGGSGGAPGLVMDFPGDANPFVTVTRLFEGQGFKRMSQDITRPNFQSMLVETPAGVPHAVIVVTVAERDGLWWGEYAWEGAK